MMAPSSFDRRMFMKWATALPLLGYMAAQDAANKLWGKAAADNIYSKIGVRPFINARGTWTYLSGSLELPEVKEAKRQAAGHFVEIFELQRGAGKKLAEWSGAESGMVSSGAAGAISSATAGCIAGTDPEKIWQLPDTMGMKGEVVMHGGRTPFDSAVRLTGAKLVLAHSHDELRNAISPKTAMIYTTALGEKLEKAIVIAHETKVPLLLDDAAGIPPIENLKLYAKMGTDMYTFSGGKGLAGPQCSGILLGRKELIDAALANSSPWEGALCRAMKVGKEEVMGCLAAVEYWMKADLGALNREWDQRVRRIQKLVETVPDVTTDIHVPKDGNRYPTLIVKWDEKAWNFPISECDRKLREGEPRIEVLTNSNPSLVTAVHEGDPKAPPEHNRLAIVSMTLQPGEDLILGKRLREILSEARKAAKG